MFAVSRKLRSNFHNARFQGERETEKEKERERERERKGWRRAEGTILEKITLDSIAETTSRSSIYADHLRINSRLVNNASQRVDLLKEWTVTERMTSRRRVPSSCFNWKTSKLRRPTKNTKAIYSCCLIYFHWTRLNTIELDSFLLSVIITYLFSWFHFVDLTTWIFIRYILNGALYYLSNINFQ